MQLTPGAVQHWQQQLLVVRGVVEGGKANSIATVIVAGKNKQNNSKKHVAALRTRQEKGRERGERREESRTGHLANPLS